METGGWLVYTGPERRGDTDRGEFTMRVEQPEGGRVRFGPLPAPELALFA